MQQKVVYIDLSGLYSLCGDIWWLTICISPVPWVYSELQRMTEHKIQQQLTNKRTPVQDIG